MGQLSGPIKFGLTSKATGGPGVFVGPGVLVGTIVQVGLGVLEGQGVIVGFRVSVGSGVSDGLGVWVGGWVADGSAGAADTSAAAKLSWSWAASLTSGLQLMTRMSIRKIALTMNFMRLFMVFPSFAPFITEA